MIGHPRVCPPEHLRFRRPIQHATERSLLWTIADQWPVRSSSALVRCAAWRWHWRL